MKNNSTLLFYSFLFTILVTLISSSAVAQEHGIFELNNDQNTSKHISDKSKNQTDNKEFYDLAFNLHPTYYINKNNIKKSNHKESSILKLTFFDTQSFNVFSQDNSNYRSVKLIIVNIKTLSDLNNKLNLSNIQGLNNLKYIFIKCYFKCTEQQMKDFVLHDSNIRIFYRVENPS